MAGFLDLLFMLGVGAGLGMFYFYGLWLTIEWISRSKISVLMVLASFAIRIVLVVAAILVLSQGRWERIVACLVGFMLIRLVVLARARPAGPGQPL